jgi:xanthine dehydrogenase YagR molybdenum-binding subunit
MVWGIGAALLEESTMDSRFGDYANHDLAECHVPACADARGMQVHWLEEDDRVVNPSGIKGIGEIGIVGAAAAVVNAVRHATGIRVRDLPVRLDTLLPR